MWRAGDISVVKASITFSQISNQSFSIFFPQVDIWRSILIFTHTIKRQIRRQRQIHLENNHCDLIKSDTGQHLQVLWWKSWNPSISFSPFISSQLSQRYVPQNPFQRFSVSLETYLRDQLPDLWTFHLFNQPLLLTDYGREWTVLLSLIRELLGNPLTVSKKGQETTMTLSWKTPKWIFQKEQVQFSLRALILYKCDHIS